MNEPHQPVGAIFDTAIELPPERRAAYLNEACAGDESLRQRVEALLRAHESAGSFMDSPAADPGRETPVVKHTEQPGDRIGRYKLLQQIGEGGCGVVYMAEQEESVRRRVALKVIKLGMDTRQVIARFEAERQALALMDHPNIAKVLDAGATETGRPYFVMELVRGIKITEYCDQNNLSTRERLDQFIQICRAIQHAHQKGIIHRDIKPSNILVADHDGVPMPKIIDFGIAKATTDQRLTDKTFFTSFEQFIGTPAYMSPEQATLSGLDIDTRSDIYSLGVLLYELLTGTTPFEAKRLLEAGLDEIRRIIRDEEPVRPSTRLHTLDAAKQTTVAKHRQTEPPKLVHLLRGDLDWIVMKALEKDRARRYETANGLAIDIQRHLDDEPVVARPPSKLYLFQKLVRRNKLIFAGGVVVSASLLLGLSATTVAVFRIHRDNQQIRKTKDNALEKLRASYLSEARAERTSGRAGQRFASLEAVSKAAAIRPDLDARNEAIACLGVSDVRLVKQTALRSTNPDPQVRFDANLEQYAVDEGQGNITIRAVLDDHEIMVLPGPGVAVAWILGFSPDRRFLAVGYANDTVWVWDLADEKPALRDLPGYRAGDFSPDSRFFALSTPDGNLWFHELTSARQTRQLAVRKRFALLAFDPKGTRLACAAFGEPSLQIRGVESGVVVSTCPVDPGFVAWSPDGKLLATGCWDGRVYVWDAKDGRKLETLEGHNQPVMSVAFSHAGDLLASSSLDDDLRLWNPNTGRQIVSFAGCAYGIHFSADDQRLPIVQQGSQLGVLAVVQSPEYRRLSAPALGRDHSGPAFSPDGRIIAAGMGDRVCFWDTSSGKEVAFVHVGPCDAVLFPPDGKSLITSERAGLYSRPLQRLPDSSRCSYKLAGPRQLYDVPDPREAALSLDGRHLAVVANHLEGESVILDLEDPSARVILRRHPLVDYIAISPNAHWAATASYQNSIVKVWDARSGQLVKILSMPARTRLTFSPDGRWLAAFSTEYQLWEVGTWQRRNVPIPGHSLAHSTFLAFSPDTGVTAIVQEGRKIQLIETLTARPLANLEAPDAANIASLRFSPDGSQLAALEQNQRLQLWDLRLIRKQLRELKLDWSLPTYPQADLAMAKCQVILEVDPGTDFNPFATPELASTIPARDARAKTSLIDLTLYYNASLILHSGLNDLRDVPRGIQTLAGVQFDVRGLIQVGAESPAGPKYPTQVSGIALRCTCQRLHFLHGALFVTGATNGTRLGSYVIHYANDRRAEVPIVVGESLAGGYTPTPNDNESFTIAWGGRDTEHQGEGILTYLFKSTWQNPFPADAIASIDFVSNPPEPFPFLVAITAEP